MINIIKELVLCFAIAFILIVYAVVILFLICSPFIAAYQIYNWMV